MIDFKLMYNDLCYELSKRLKRELTVSEDNRVFIDVMRVLMGKYPLPRDGGVGFKRNLAKAA